jgi:two-component system response regulator NreC
VTKVTCDNDIGAPPNPSSAAAARQRINVLLAEDHAIFRQGLRSLLSGDEHMAIVGEAGDGQQAIQLATELRPDVVIMDLSMPGTNGTEAIPKIKCRVEQTKIIALTAHSAEEYVRATLQAGASAYVLKEDSHQDLVTAINCVMAGKIYLSPGICKGVVSGFLCGLGEPGGASTKPAAKITWDALTLREREVLKLIAEGNSNKDMARYLHLSVKTVEKHRANVMKKLGAKSAADVTAFAIREGLLGR